MRRVAASDGHQSEAPRSTSSNNPSARPHRRLRRRALHLFGCNLPRSAVLPLRREGSHRFGERKTQREGKGTNMTDVVSITRRGLMIHGSAVAGVVAATSSAQRALAQGGPTERLAYVGCYTPPGEGIV